MKRKVFICVIIIRVLFVVVYGIGIMVINNNFYIKEFTKTDDIFQEIKGKSYRDDCVVPVGELRYVHILYKNFQGKTKKGELIVNKYIAQDVLEIFRQLYKEGYEIESVRLIDEFNADDEMSMEYNNSSSFNFRFITHSKKVSKHGYGLAIDINPLYNPYYKKTDEGEEIVEPINAKEYVDRTKEFKHKIDEKDPAYKLFTEHGFEWGGDWKSCKDYQHFEVPDEVVDKLYN